jgi:hypothetical protein
MDTEDATPPTSTDPDVPYAAPVSMAIDPEDGAVEVKICDSAADAVTDAPALEDAMPAIMATSAPVPGADAPEARVMDDDVALLRPEAIVMPPLDPAKPSPLLISTGPLPFEPAVEPARMSTGPEYPDGASEAPDFSKTDPPLPFAA